MGELALSRERDLFEEGVLKKKVRSFIPSVFIICPLPIRGTKEDVKEYVKKYNDYEMRLIGTNGIPGGKIARDFLMLFTTEAVYRKNEGKEGIKITFNKIEELRGLLNINRRDYGNTIISMLEKFSGCSIYFKSQKRFEMDGQTMLFDIGLNRNVKEYNRKGNSLVFNNAINIPFIHQLKNIDLLKEGRKRGKPIIIEIEITGKFVELVKDNAVPIDFNVYREIGSSIEKDLYAWFSYRNYTARNAGAEEVFISRENLLSQFGEEFEANERVKYQRIMEAIYSIKKNYYTELKYKVVNERYRKTKGIILYRSPLVIEEKDTRYVPLLTNI
jgi:hypothetical protein